MRRLALATLLFVCSCTRPAAPAAVAPPVHPEFVGTTWSLRGADRSERGEIVSLAFDTGATPTWRLTGSRFAPGSLLEAAGQKVTAGADGTLSLELPATQDVARVRLDEYAARKSTLAPSFTATVTPAGVAPQQVRWAALDVHAALSEWLRREVEAGRSVQLGTPSVPPTLLLVDAVPVAAGPGTTLGDVGYFVTSRAQGRPDTCRGYVGGPYTRPTDIGVERQAARYEVHAGASGGVVHSGELVAALACPQKAKVSMMRPGFVMRLTREDKTRWLEAAARAVGPRH